MDNRIKYVALGLSAITPENIDVIFAKKYKTWLYDNGDKKEWLSKDEHYKKNKDGIELTETQFIKKELRKLSKFNYDLLKDHHVLKCDFYKEYLETRLNENTLKSKLNKPLDYVLIGSLFAQGFIKQKGNTWYYKETPTPSVNDLAKLIHKTEPTLKKLKESTIYTSVNGTLSRNSKSIYENETQMRKTYVYCKDHNISITDSEFKKALDFHCIEY